ncbi:TetR/AcrR family transcriptional regulator [Endozoicomonas arenosclerae]|uniref:TetR/AcrR family transcriptional regulator n=1 Tax=Endozoicomonas arenosclerae TaxID=1633495 RepID=UPI000780F3BA|nr:TetR/AcrR family transcriptional regulator [Endozoicomonas arenosclerae]
MSSDPFSQQSQSRDTKASRTLNLILDAALSCYERNGIDKTNIDEVAREAGVSRTTFYRYAKNREDLFNQVLKRDAQERTEERNVALRYHDNLADVLIDGALFNMRGRKHRTMFKLLFSEDQPSAIGRGNLSPANFRPMARSMIENAFNRELERGNIREGMTLDLAVEFICRILLSLMAHPDPFLDDERSLRQFLEATLLPPIIKD